MVSETHENEPIPPGDYMLTPVSITNNWLVKFKITEGEYKGRILFGAIKQLFPHGIKATISTETMPDDTVRNRLHIHHGKE